MHVVKPRLLSLATAVPAYQLRQEDVRSQAHAIFREDPSVVDRLLPVFGNAGIETRYSCVPAPWYEDDHGWSDRNALYITASLDLLSAAAGRALAQAQLAASDIDAIVCVSTTGIATPSLEARLLDRLAFRRDVRRLPVFGLGCAGGVLGLARAADMAAAWPTSRVLLLVVELCALTFRRRDRSPANIVAAALFGDGAAAAVLSTEGKGPVIVAAGEHTWPNSADVMGWGVESDGFAVIFSRDIPQLIRTRLPAVIDDFLGKHGFGRADIDRFVSHPGGAKVLDALEEVFALAPGALNHSRSVLRDYGNMSAASVLFVLERTWAAGSLDGRALMTAVGPGFSAGFLVLETGL
ncbi:MAG: 3-oxoacyl-[acyl-carrier-protein] synthase III C-terminal domain-containing protein [Defluviicoccus sp.]